MLQIPIDKTEQRLTDWIGDQLRSGNLAEDDKQTLQLLLRISMAQMVQRHRGEDYPFIEELLLTPEEYEYVCFLPLFGIHFDSTFFYFHFSNRNLYDY